MGCACEAAAPSMGDFATFASDPQFSSAWGTVAGVLQSEGASALEVRATQEQFADAFSQMTSPGINLDAGQALAGAQQLMLAGRTVSGAIAQVKGLASAAAGGDPGPAFSAFAGTLVAAATTAGVVSAGVGAMVVLGATLVGDALSGLFGGAPTVARLCDVDLTQQPTFIADCVASFAPVVMPGAFGWRRFPEPSNGPDRVWWAQGIGAASFRWGDPSPGAWLATSLFVDHMHGQDGRRPIDIAFLPNRDGQGELTWWQASAAPGAYPGAMGAPGFGAAFFSAWKANAEYKLNGCKAAPDWQVLLHTVRLWNRAHTGWNYYDITPASPQIGGLVTALRNNVGNDPAGAPTNYMVGGNLRMYTGAPVAQPVAMRVVPSRVVSLHVGAGASTAMHAASLAVGAGGAVAAHPMSTTGKVMTGAAAAAGLGAAAWVGAHGWDVTRAARAVRPALGRLARKVQR
jgi:hypothetical protein